jgi:hypothetical protein
MFIHIVSYFVSKSFYSDLLPICDNTIFYILKVKDFAINTEIILEHSVSVNSNMLLSELSGATMRVLIAFMYSEKLTWWSV